MLRTILITFVGVILAAVAYGFTLPDATHVERSTTINATPAQVFAVLNSFKDFNAWSPWNKAMPADKTTYEGPESGVGAKMIWSGEKSGEGSQEIVESVPDSLVRTQLDFGFMGQPKAAFILAGEGAGTKVTWAFDAVHGYNVLDRYFGKFMVGTEVGKMYESGLVDLKAFIEAKAAAEQAAADAAAAEAAAAAMPKLLSEQTGNPGDAPTIVTLAAVPIAYVGAEMPLAPDADAKAQDVIGAAYGKLMPFVMKYNLPFESAPIVVTREYQEGVKWVFDAAAPLAAIPEGTPAEEDGVKTGMTPAGRAVKLIFKGPYDAMAPAYQAIEAYMAANNLTQGDVAIEEYVTDPGVTAPEENITNIYMFVKETP